MKSEPNFLDMQYVLFNFIFCNVSLIIQCFLQYFYTTAGYPNPDQKIRDLLLRN